MVRQPVQEKENSEFKPIVLRVKNWNCATSCLWRRGSVDTNICSNVKRHSFYDEFLFKIKLFQWNIILFAWLSSFKWKAHALWKMSVHRITTSGKFVVWPSKLWAFLSRWPFTQPFTLTFWTEKFLKILKKMENVFCYLTACQTLKKQVATFSRQFKINQKITTLYIKLPHFIVNKDRGASAKIPTARLYIFPVSSTDSKTKVGDRSRGRPEGSLFNCYYTEV